ncbi:MAG: hypothetical protein AAFR38_12675 [Planctomycetota bacterium]
MRPANIAKVAFAVVALGAGVTFVLVRGERPITQPDEILLIDLTSGDRFRADVSGSRAIILPAKNPETGEYTLVPISRDDTTDRWSVAGGHYVEEVKNALGSDGTRLGGLASESGLEVAPSDRPIQDLPER